MQVLESVLTMAMSPAARPIRGLTAMTTRVSFQPPMKPTMNPKMKVEIRSMKIDTWSAMALLILLMSLRKENSFTKDYSSCIVRVMYTF